MVSTKGRLIAISIHALREEGDEQTWTSTSEWA